MDNGTIFDMDPAYNQFSEMPRISLSVLNGLSYNPFSQALAVAGEPSYTYQKGLWQELKLFRPDDLTSSVTINSLHLSPVFKSPDWVSSSSNRLTVLFHLKKKNCFN